MVPLIIPRVVQGNQMSRLRIDAGQVCAFVCVTSVACHAKEPWVIARLIQVLLGKDVIDTKRQHGTSNETKL